MKWLASKAAGMRIFDDENGVIDAYNMDYRTPESVEAEIQRCISEGMKLAETF